MYRVVVNLLDNTGQIVTRFRKKESAQVFHLLLQEQLLPFTSAVKDVALVNVSSANGTMRPTHTPPTGAHWWCPYCSEYRLFVKMGGYRRCETCWVSDVEFGVVRANPELFRIHNRPPRKKKIKVLQKGDLTRDLNKRRTRLERKQRRQRRKNREVPH